MKLFILLALAVILAVTSATFVHMEKMLLDERPEFVLAGRADVTQMHEVTFAVKQRNLDSIDKYLTEVSTPGSPKFLKHLTRDEVGLITSNPEAVTFVENYLKKNGAIVVSKTLYGEYITAKAPIALWEKVFDTTFFNFKHVNEVIKPVARSLDYSVDEELSEHIFAVFDTAQLPFVRDNNRPLADPLTATTGTVTPALINSFYNITSNTGSTLASQSLFESLGQYMSPADLTLFQKNYKLPVQPISADVNGYVSDDACLQDANNCVEANLDVQYIMAVAQNVPTTYWYQGGSDIFLSWIRAVAASPNPPLINSISYGGIEPAVPKSIANAFNTEAMKLGAQGVSIFVSSGDDGVAGAQARGKPRKCGYSPSFPATSPYVTAVGATQGPESGQPEIACSSSTGGIITTGGGFSTKYAAPSWQTATIANYFSGLTTQPVTGFASGGRGYPDLSLLGFNYEVVVGGQTFPVSGTSASAPTLAGFFSLVNSARLAAGKKPLGFLNPSIYKYAPKFANDITSGFNNCVAGKTSDTVCCSQGFLATAGWDPVTGFGSVNYSKLYSVFFNI